MVSTSNAFAELGLAPGATEAEVRAAWRRLASRWHPDRNDDAAAVEKMQRINQAYEAIRRASARDEPDDDAPPPPEAPRRTVKRRVRLTLEDAAAGCTRVLQGKLTDPCAACAGAGHRLSGRPCGACEGEGTVRQRAWYGWTGSRLHCEACAGSGTERQPCAACDGSGKAPPRPYELKVRIPHGARHGDLLHVGGGHPRPGQAAVDLDLRVELLPHPLFTLDDDGTTHGTVPVDGFAWVAERAIQVPTPNGLRSLALCRDQRSYRLPGQGFPSHRRGERAAHRVEIEPLFPPQLSIDQQILIDQLIAGSADARLSAWQDSVRAWAQAQSSGPDAATR